MKWEGDNYPDTGDPGWSIDWVPEAEGALFPDAWRKCMENLPPTATGCYEAWIGPVWRDLEEAVYLPKEIVRHHIRIVLDNFRNLYPERAEEVDKVIKRFKLEDAIMQPTPENKHLL